jgi:hypothetical protein
MEGVCCLQQAMAVPSSLAHVPSCLAHVIAACSSSPGSQVSMEVRIALVESVCSRRAVQSCLAQVVAACSCSPGSRSEKARRPEPTGMFRPYKVWLEAWGGTGRVAVCCRQGL